MNVEIQKKIQERKTKSVKAQSSMEYMMILAVVGIIIVLAIGVILTFGGKASKGASLNAELLSAEASSNTLSIATNLPLNLISVQTVSINGVSYNTIPTTLTQYNVSGGYEYSFTTTSANAIGVGVGNTISSIRIPGTDTSTGSQILLLPASGTSVPVESGTAPFAITSIGSG